MLRKVLSFSIVELVNWVNETVQNRRTIERIPKSPGAACPFKAKSDHDANCPWQFCGLAALNVKRGSESNHSLHHFEDFHRKLEGNGPVEPAASRAIEDKHV